MRKRVVSIITLPVRLLRRLAGPLVRLLRTAFAKLAGLLRSAFAKLAGLRGWQRIVAVGALAVVIVVLVLSLRPGPNSDEEVRQTLDRYAQASRAKDYQTLCDDLLSSEIVDRLRSVGLPCEVALRTGLENTKNPTLTVIGVEVNGNQALARVRGVAVGQAPGTSTYRLVREGGGWRIATSPGSENQSQGSAP
jgi:hypothetical protein